jgi:hypothetical protein
VHINEDAEGPSYSFSIGFFYTYQYPEILVMGLNHQTAHDLINVCAAHAAAGREFRPFERNGNVIKRLDCAFAPILIKYYKDYLGYALWFYQSLPGPFPADQLVWPDKSGKLPWEADYDQTFSTVQKVLSEMPAGDSPRG